MSGGGGGGTTVQEPWAQARPYLQDIMGRGFEYANNPAAFYPGATYLGPTQGQLAGWDTQLNYADQVFGGANAPNFGEATGALSGALTGSTPIGSLAGGYSGAAGTALGQMLSGTPDYSGLQGSIDAANAPLMRQFEQEFLPSLNQRATFLGNPTGGIKALNKVLPELGDRMSENAMLATEGERQRALQSQQTGLGMYGQFAQGAGSQALQGLGMFPSIAQAGAIPGQLASQFGDWGAGFQQQALQDQMNRFNYYQQLPLTSARDYLGLVGGMGGMGGTQTVPGGSTGAASLGGAISGGMMGSALAGTKAGSFLGPWGMLGGAAIGALLPYLGD